VTSCDWGGVRFYLRVLATPLEVEKGKFVFLPAVAVVLNPSAVAFKSFPSLGSLPTNLERTYSLG